MVAPFKNEPFTDFKDPTNRAAFEEALARVEREMGKEHPLVIDGERVRRPTTLRTMNPAKPDQVIGLFVAATPADADANGCGWPGPGLPS